MIGFDNFSCPDKLWRREIFSEIHKITMIEDPYGLEDYFQGLSRMIPPYFGVKFAVVLSSRLLALQSVLKALGCGCSDEVILSTYNSLETAGAVRNIGAKPVFVDIKNNLTIAEDMIPSQITKNTKAIIYTQILGPGSDYKKINNISSKYNVPFVEHIDNSNFVNFDARHLGERGVACVNFVTSSSFGIGGDASIILLNNQEIYSRLIDVLDFPLVSNSRYHRAVAPVILDPIVAALLKVKIDHVGLFEKKIVKIRNIYKQNLSTDVFLGQNYILVKDPNGLTEFLGKKGIEIRRGYACLHLNDRFSSSRDKAFSKAEAMSSKILRLPMHVSLSERKIKYICENIKQYLRHGSIFDYQRENLSEKTTLIKEHEVVSVFKHRQDFLSAQKGYGYFSEITDVPKTVFKEKDNKMIMVSEFINDEKHNMDARAILKRMGRVLSRLHQKSKIKTPGTVYDFLISKDYYPKHKEIIGLIKMYKTHFQDSYIHHIHGDFTENNVLFSSGKAYLVDLGGYRIFDRYFDFAAVYLCTCHENPDLFSAFLKSYFNKTNSNFSHERFYINLLIKLLSKCQSNYEHKRCPSRVLFDYYFNVLLNSRARSTKFSRRMFSIPQGMVEQRQLVI